MKKLLLCVALVLLSGCAPYVDRREIDVFNYACRNDGGLSSIKTYPFAVTEAVCADGKEVWWEKSSKEYQQSLQNKQQQ